MSFRNVSISVLLGPSSLFTQKALLVLTSDNHEVPTSVIVLSGAFSRPNSCSLQQQQQR